MKRAVHRRLVFLGVAAIMLVMTGMSWGATQKQNRAPKARAMVASNATKSVKSRAAHNARVRASASSAGMRIFKDPETGAIGRPTDENIRILAQESGPQVDISNLPQTKLPNGGWMIETGGIEDAVIMQIDAKGNRVMRCVTNPKQALKQKPVAASSQQREDR